MASASLGPPPRLAPVQHRKPTIRLVEAVYAVEGKAACRARAHAAVHVLLQDLTQASASAS